MVLETNNFGYSFRLTAPYLATAKSIPVCTVAEAEATATVRSRQPATSRTNRTSEAIQHIVMVGVDLPHSSKTTTTGAFGA